MSVHLRLCYLFMATCMSLSTLIPLTTAAQPWCMTTNCSATLKSSSPCSLYLAKCTVHSVPFLISTTPSSWTMLHGMALFVFTLKWLFEVKVFVSNAPHCRLGPSTSTTAGAILFTLSWRQTWSLLFLIWHLSVIVLLGSSRLKISHRFCPSDLSMMMTIQRPTNLGFMGSGMALFSVLNLAKQNLFLPLINNVFVSANSVIID